MPVYCTVQTDVSWSSIVQSEGSVVSCMNPASDSWSPRGSLTKAMAASSLQNSSNTMTPFKSVAWSVLEGNTHTGDSLLFKSPFDTQVRFHSLSVVRRFYLLSVRNKTQIKALHSLLLEAHQLFSDTDESLSEVWDVLDPLHQLSNHLQRNRRYKKECYKEL